MKESKHTKGPWEIRRGEKGEVRIAGGPDYYLLCGMYFTGYPGDVEANARLMAAAPELLAALADVNAMFDALCNDGRGACPNNAIHERIRAALAKAGR